MKERHRVLDIRSQNAFEHHNQYQTDHDTEADRPARRRVSLWLTVVLALGGVLWAPALQGAHAAPVFNNPPAGGISIIVFPQRDFISASGFLVDDQVVVRVIHDPLTYPGAVGSSTLAITPSGDPADVAPAFSGIVEVNHPGGACWVGLTPDIRPGDKVQTEIVANLADPTRVGRIDETTVQNVTNKRPVQTAAEPAGTVVVHGNATTSFDANPGAPLDLAILEHRIVAPGSQFDRNGRRTLRATAAAGADGTLSFDPIDAITNPIGTRWTATYANLSPADVTLALGAESRGMWLGNAIAPSLETTVYEIGALTAAGPAAPCSAPLEVLPPPPGSELIPPTDPTGLTASVDNFNTITLNWTASTDNVGVTAYGVYRNGVAIFTVSNPDGSAPAPTTLIDRNTPPGTYTFQVRAFDEVGNASGFSDPTAEVTAAARFAPGADAFPVPINDPPLLPVNIIVFPSRDFISPSGYLDSDRVTVEVIRNGVIVSSADGIIPIDGFAEVNHPGGACWEGVTPEIRVGDIVRTIAYNPASIIPATNPDGIRTIDQTKVSGVTAFRPIVTVPATETGNDGVVQIHGTAMGADGQPLPADQIEQRMIATRDHFNFNGRRAMRAAAGGADGTLVYDTQNNPMGVNWTSTYTGLDADDVARMAGGTNVFTGRVFPGADTRIHWLGSQPLLLAEATIFENADGNPPGPAGPACTRPLENADVTAPTAPAGFDAVQDGANQVTLSWSPSSDDWYVAGYRIYRDGVAIANTTATATKHTLNGIAPGTHTYSVKAFDTASPRGVGATIIEKITAGFGNMYGNLSGPGADKTLVQADVTPPSVPLNVSATTTNVSADGLALGSATLTWAASSDDVGVASYNVYDGLGSLIASVASPATTYTAPDLAVGSYIFTVDAVDAAGNHSARSDGVAAFVVQTPDTEPPSVPGGVSASTQPDIHGRNVVVTWSPSTDNVGVAGYKVFRDDGSIRTLRAQVSGSTLTYNDVLLAADTFTYTITAFDSAPNESAQSAATIAVVANDPPLAPHSIIAFPSRDFVSATGYTPGETYFFTLIRGGQAYFSDLLPADATGTIEVNHPGGTCWIGLNTPDMRPGDVIRITDSTGVAEQTTVANVTAERPIATNDNTVVIHGTAVAADGVSQIPVGQIEQRLIVGTASAFDLNGSRLLRTGNDGVIAYDGPGSTKWTATYTGLTANDMLRAVGGTSPTGTVFPGAESRAHWLGRFPLAFTEATIFENGPGVVGGPSAPCSAPAEPNRPAASFTPTSVSFPGTQFLPTPVATSTPVTVTFGNGGLSPMTLTNIYFAGLNPGDFSRFGGTCPAVFPATLSAGTTCTVKVTFSPTALKLRQANLSFADNAANTTDQSVALTGIGVDSTNPVIFVSSANIPLGSFGTVNGGSFTDRTFIVTNDVHDPTARSLTISNATIGGANAADFKIQENTCGLALAPANPPTPAGQCWVTVRFTPGARTARTATLTLTHNAAPTATSTAIALSGTGGNGSVLSFASNPVNFGTVNRGTTKDQTISVKNAGNQAATLNLASFTVTGAGYTVRSTTCATLAANGSCNVVVRFTAPNTVNSFPGTLSVTAANGLPTKVTTNLVATTK